jgi:RNA polymerase sigma factor (sigma-70 family)
MRRHAPALVNFLTRLVGGRDDAEDVAQNTFVAIHRNLHRYDENRSFVTWMYFIARNKAKDHHRRRSVLRWVGLEDDGIHVPSREADPETEISDRDDLRQLSGLMEKLPEGLRLPLILSALEGLPLAQIGEIMGISAKAVEVRVYRARKLLKERFGHEGQ